MQAGLFRYTELMSQAIPKETPAEKPAEAESGRETPQGLPETPRENLPRNRPVEEDELLGKAFDWTLTKRLFTFLGPHRADVRRALLLSLLIAGLGLVGPYLLKVAIDSGIRRNNFPWLLTASLLYLGVQVGVWVCSYDQQVRLSRMGQNVLFALRDALFAHLQRLSLDFYDHRASGRLISRLTNDIESLNNVITSGAINLVADGLSLIGIVLIMLALNARLAVMTFALIPVIAVVSRFFGRRARLAFRESRKKI